MTDKLRLRKKRHEKNLAYVEYLISVFRALRSRINDKLFDLMNEPGDENWNRERDGYNACRYDCRRSSARLGTYVLILKG